jgi:peptidoglycan/xylan/chitin deacetylase (PgdA/CDA1 family)
LNRKILVFLFLVLLSPFTFAEVRFEGLDISPENYLVFKATTDLPDFGTYDTLFQANLANKKLKQLTFFPEKIAFLEETQQLQIQNRYGVFRSDSKLENLTTIELFPSFVEGHEIGSGKISPIISSPDGKYLLYTRQSSPAYGRLVLYDQPKAKETVISDRVELSFRDPVAKWSPDSTNFVYSSGGHLYYFSINQYNENRVLAENFRRVHVGNIHSAHWSTTGNLYFIVGTLVYRIGSHEFFTKSLYSDLLQVGDIVGKIPFRFNPNFDEFWISPDGGKILLNIGGRNLFLYYMKIEDFITTGSPTSLPYLYLPRNTFVKTLVWSKDDTVTLLAQSIVKGQSQTRVFRLLIDENNPPSAFVQTTEKGVLNLHLSPEERTIALVRNDRIHIYNHQAWTREDEILYDQPIAVLWRSEREILIAGAFKIILYNLNIETSKLIALSQPGDFGFTEDSSFIQTKQEKGIFQRTVTDNGWQSSRDFSIREKEVASKEFRVYLRNSTRGSYRNVIMVRSIAGFGTVPLLPPEEIAYEAFPKEEDPLDLTNFNHGSRIRRREIALTFDAIDSIEGLTTILNTLKEYGLKCTFFVNGEAIRRYPAAINEIAESGHEVGSLFYTHFNMTDSQFIIDRNFIMQGLARTEDDYYAATGKEVSLLWHAPYYFINSEIIAASREMNYTYVGRDVDAMDWVTEDGTSLVPGLYLGAADLVERVLQKKKPGSIVPIQIGVPEGNRQDYLFQKLDLIINGLQRLGYDVVTVSELMEHAR